MTTRCRSLLRRLRADDGNALVEFTNLGLLLLIPVGYLVVTVFHVQRAAFGVTQATREAGRAYVASGADPAAAVAAAQLAMHDQGLELRADQLRLRCAPDPSRCGAPGSTVTVLIDAEVGLPFVPSLFGRLPARIPVHGRHDERVDCYRSGPPAAASDQLAEECP